MDERPTLSRSRWIRFGLVMHTVVFALCAYYALVRLAGASLLVFDDDSCATGWPCAAFEADWPVTVGATLCQLLLVAAGTVLHVESLAYARRPDGGQLSLACGAAALLLPATVYLLSGLR